MKVTCENSNAQAQTSIRLHLLIQTLNALRYAQLCTSSLQAESAPRTWRRRRHRPKRIEDGSPSFRAEPLAVDSPKPNGLRHSMEKELDGCGSAESPYAGAEEDERGATAAPDPPGVGLAVESGSACESAAGTAETSRSAFADAALQCNTGPNARNLDIAPEPADTASQSAPCPTKRPMPVPLSASSANAARFASDSERGRAARSFAAPKVAPAGRQRSLSADAAAWISPRCNPGPAQRTISAMADVKTDGLMLHAVASPVSRVPPWRSPAAPATVDARAEPPVRQPQISPYLAPGGPAGQAAAERYAPSSAAAPTNGAALPDPPPPSPAFELAGGAAARPQASPAGAPPHPADRAEPGHAERADSGRSDVLGAIAEAAAAGSGRRGDAGLAEAAVAIRIHCKIDNLRRLLDHPMVGYLPPSPPAPPPHLTQALASARACAATLTSQFVLTFASSLRLLCSAPAHTRAHALPSWCHTRTHVLRSGCEQPPF